MELTTAANLFQRCRKALYLSPMAMTTQLALASERTLKRWETGEREVPGPAWIAIWYMLMNANRIALAEEVEQFIREHIHLPRELIKKAECDATQTSEPDLGERR